MKIKNLFASAVMCLVSISSFAYTIESQLISKVTLDTDNNTTALNEHPFFEKVTQNFINTLSEKLDNNESIIVFNEDKSWSQIGGNVEGTHVLRFSISARQFIKGKFRISGVEHSALYLNKSLCVGNKEHSVSLLNQDYRALLIVTGVESWDDFSIEWIADHDSESLALNEKNDGKSIVRIQDTDKGELELKAEALMFGNDSENKRASMKQYYDSETIASLNISPDGELLIWSKRSYNDLGGDSPETMVEIIEIDSQDVVYRWHAMNPRNLAWSDDSKSLIFTHANAIFKLNRKNWSIKKLASDVSGIRSIDWLSDSELIVTWHKSEDKPHAFTKRYRALEDRWSYWRGNMQIHKFDITSGLFKQVSKNPISSMLLDIKQNTRKALISRSPVDYAEPPHGLSQLFEIDLDTGTELELGEYRTFNTAYYHEDGIVIAAGPNFKGGLGKNISHDGFANDYDGQLYLLDERGNIKALTKDFSPAINQSMALSNGDLVMLATDQDRRQLYTYDMDEKEFEKVSTQVDVISSFTLSQGRRADLVYAGTTASKPQIVVKARLGAKKQSTLFDSAKQDFANVDFIQLKEWDYTTKSGQFIDGRVYYPANFDDSKQYPAIVYYYGGTVPVSRGFTGRWPFSLWASQGYVVYVLQPSGATGYGQDFSTRHVNAWGINTADEIIESTKAFVDAHEFVDGERLGNMGASYGGFMTMYLATKTDMFAASISHAGISNLTSYWGYGWWGYGYSGQATRGSFPWNRSDFYVKQSPVFAADKVTTPLLLIHGDADTNVPVGESHQMYTALKLLGQDVELVEFQGDDHHINSRERRMRWWSTILSYFDMKLKQQPQWWEELYPEPKS